MSRGVRMAPSRATIRSEAQHRPARSSQMEKKAPRLQDRLAKVGRQAWSGEVCPQVWCRAIAALKQRAEEDHMQSSQVISHCRVTGLRTLRQVKPSTM
mmetsp:Transcript_79256/g.177547  ORF Transcript_79256/g.177547 Transcript_79256/m.177547 type:complete len:98 (-) Transcript_79256:850-1143(-)